MRCVYEVTTNQKMTRVQIGTIKILKFVSRLHTFTCHSPLVLVAGVALCAIVVLCTTHHKYMYLIFSFKVDYLLGIKFFSRHADFIG